jgi:hypothetical protein
MNLPERTIQSQILQYLGYRGIKAFRINAGMIPTGEKRSRRMIRLAPKGFSDVVAVLPGSGRAVFIEIKTAKGKTTPFQDIFLEEMREQGALAFVARSTEDVERELEEVMAR